MTRTVHRPTAPDRGASATPTDTSRRNPVVRLPRIPQRRLPPTWRQADPERIAAALAAAQRRDPGGWHVVGQVTDIGRRRSIVRNVAGREVVLWRGSDGALHAGPGACPHLGAPLDNCPVTGSTVHCRWHGMAFTPSGSPGWRPFPAHDDGLLAWVQLPTEGESARAQPVMPRRPPDDRSVSAVVTMQGRCEPCDVIANRLDPWHGSWLHPYAFSHLRVDDAASTEDELVVDVAFRLGRAFAVPVRAVFSCPDARTIVMHIVDGEGAGSVVETHATPIGLDQTGTPTTQVTELTMAYSGRAGFQVAQRLAVMIRPAMRHTARHLWRDDLDYAQRRYRVRTGDAG